MVPGAGLKAPASRGSPLSARKIREVNEFYEQHIPVTIRLYSTTS